MRLVGAFECASWRGRGWVKGLGTQKWRGDGYKLVRLLQVWDRASGAAKRGQLSLPGAAKDQESLWATWFRITAWLLVEQLAWTNLPAWGRLHTVERVVARCKR